ncbi:putative s-adenosylmethionine-dependent methyltransferase [Quercus suber]|uniref:S-adenosylmethionine-dependent methyltransferase n=1 Tax=Quercus suber TaxID=58331 RepID=A0AAW0LG10_QUESU
MSPMISTLSSSPSSQQAIHCSWGTRFLPWPLVSKESLHFIHSSFALQWLSKVPMEVMDEGEDFYIDAQKEVVEAFATQFAEDMESFLFARAQELAVGGLLPFFIPGIPDVMSNSDTFIGKELDLLGSCLMDMAKVGLFSEAKVDAFNMLAYFTTPKELKALIERNS